MIRSTLARTRVGFRSKRAVVETVVAFGIGFTVVAVVFWFAVGRGGLDEPTNPWHFGIAMATTGLLEH